MRVLLFKHKGVLTNFTETKYRQPPHAYPTGEALANQNPILAIAQAACRTDAKLLIGSLTRSRKGAGDNIPPPAKLGVFLCECDNPLHWFSEQWQTSIDAAEFLIVARPESSSRAAPTRFGLLDLGP